MYNLSVPNYCYWLGVGAPNRTLTREHYPFTICSCTVLFRALNMCLWQVSWSLTGHLSVTFSGAPNFDVAYSLDGPYLGPFTFLGLTAMLKKTPKPDSDNGAYYLLFENVY